MTSRVPSKSDDHWLDRRDRQAAASLNVGLFSYLRELERAAGKRPRIGRNAKLRDGLVRLGQDPSLVFADRDIARLDADAKVPQLRAQFMGFFGPFGAFPLNWTEEAQRWFAGGDEAFVAFVDIFTARFQELFFRAWSDARQITQFDHPDDDRFQVWLLSFLGLGTPAFRNRDRLHDIQRIRFLGLLQAEVKSPVRLRQMIELLFGSDISVEIEEFVPCWLEFEDENLCKLGLGAARLGQDCHLGRRMQSVNEKIILHLKARTCDQFDALLPEGHSETLLSDLVFGYVGQRYEIDVQLYLPSAEIKPAELGQTARLGYMACMKSEAADPRSYQPVARYELKRHQITRANDQPSHTH